MSEETVFRARLSQDRSVSELSSEDGEKFWETFQALLADTAAGNFQPAVYYHLGAADAVSGGEPVEYSPLPLSMYRDLPEKHYASISELIENYYREKNALTRIRQKSADLRKIVQTILERAKEKSTAFTESFSTPTAITSQPGPPAQSSITTTPEKS